MSEAFFDSVYSGGADYYGLEARPEFHSFVRALPGPKPKCLDLACGQGRHAIPAARIGARVHAVDYSCVAIDQLRAFASDTRLAIEAECADVRILNPPAQAYDAVFLVSTLSHFDEPDLQPIVDVAKRALAEGGRIFVEAFTTADTRISRLRRSKRDRLRAQALFRAECAGRFIPPVHGHRISRIHGRRSLSWSRPSARRGAADRGKTIAPIIGFLSGRVLSVSAKCT